MAPWHVEPMPPEFGMTNGYFLWCLGLDAVICCTALGSLGGNGITLQSVNFFLKNQNISQFCQYLLELFLLSSENMLLPPLLLHTVL